MFRRAICALTAWAVLTPFAHAYAGDDEASERKAGPGQSLAASPEQASIEPASSPRKLQAPRLGPTIAAAAQLSDAPVPPVPPVPAAPPVPPVPPGPSYPVAESPRTAPADPYNPYAGPRIPQPKDHQPDLDPHGRTWTRLEILLWSASGQHVPPAITASPPGTPANFAGIISNPGTEVLFPRDRTNNEFRMGFRATSGYWLDPEQNVGLEGDFLFLGHSKKGLTAASDLGGNQIIARPFFNVLTGAPAALVVAFPNQARGVIDVRAENFVAGGAANMLFNLRADPCNRLDFVLGYRYLGVFDEVSFEHDTTALAAQPGIPFATRTQVLDRFNTANHFNGAVFGFNTDRRFGIWFVGGRATVAFGGVKEESTIDGRMVVTPASGLAHATYQGLYTQSSNIGHRERTWFAVLPEVSLRVGVQFSGSTRFYVGYNWLYLSSVARAGDQIDTRVNPSFFPSNGGVGVGPQYPGFQRLMKTDFWMQGMSFGMEMRF